MKYNQVTWYSKVIAMVLFIALPFVGFYLGMKYQEGINPQINNVVNTTPKSDTKTVVNTDKVTVKTTYENGVLKYSGSVQVPTPCYTLEVKASVLESFPEQVQIKLNVNELAVDDLENVNVCAQVVTEKEFSGEVQVSEDATVTVFLNDEQVN